MYAIVRTGGKQHRVEEGRPVVVERLPAEEGSTVELADVLLIADDGQVTIGTPVIEGARVVAQVEAHGRGKKLIVFKYKAKVRTRKKMGHRQAFTRLVVQEILRPGEESKTAEQPKPRRRKAEEAAPEAPEAATAEATAEAPAKAPARRTRRTAAPEAEATAEKPARAPRRAAKPAAEKPEPKPRARRAAPKKTDETKTPRRRTPRAKKDDTE